MGHGRKSSERAAGTAQPTHTPSAPVRIPKFRLENGIARSAAVEKHEGGGLGFLPRYPRGLWRVLKERRHPRPGAPRPSRSRLRVCLVATIAHLSECSPVVPCVPRLPRSVPGAESAVLSTPERTWANGGEGALWSKRQEKDAGRLAHRGRFGCCALGLLSAALCSPWACACRLTAALPLLRALCGACRPICFIRRGQPL